MTENVTEDEGVEPRGDLQKAPNDCGDHKRFTTLKRDQIKGREARPISREKKNRGQ